MKKILLLILIFLSACTSTSRVQCYDGTYVKSTTECIDRNLAKLEYIDKIDAKPIFNFSNMDFKSGGDYTEVSGWVTNIGNKDAEYVKVYIDYYETKEGQPTGSDWTYVQGTGIPAGQKRSFKVMTPVPDGTYWRYVKYRVNVD